MFFSIIKGIELTEMVEKEKPRSTAGLGLWKRFWHKIIPPRRGGKQADWCQIRSLSLQE